jgi:hypothetical protein
LVWSGVAVLSSGFADPQSPVYLVILAGICAGAVTYGSSYASVAINFITPPLVVTVVCLAMRADLQYGVIAVSVVLFWCGLTRGALLGQHRFIQTSRLKHEAKQLADEDGAQVAGRPADRPLQPARAGNLHPSAACRGWPFHRHADRSRRVQIRQ